MKRVYLHGYWAGNLGDDLFIRIISDRYKDVLFYVFAGGTYSRLFSKSSNVKVVNYDIFNNVIFRVLLRLLRVVFNVNLNLLELLRGLVIRRADAFVVIGGSLFMQNDSWEEQVAFYKRFIRNVKYKCILGSNFGPYVSEEYLAEYKILFRLFDDLCFRDRYTFGLFEELGNARIAPDIVFQYKPIATNATLVVAIVVKNFEISNHLKRYGVPYYDKLVQLAEYYIDHGYGVRLISFCSYEKDDEAVDKVFDSLKEKYKSRTSRHYYTDDLDAIVELLATSKHIVAARFHAMILGFVMRRPVFPICYSSKMTNVLNDIDFNGLFIDVNEIGNLVPANVFYHLEEATVDIERLAFLSENHFSNLDGFLCRRPTFD